jgi:hypothetical protein
VSTGMIRDEHQVGTLTRSQLAELRGGLDGGAWTDAAVFPSGRRLPDASAPNGNGTRDAEGRRLPSGDDAAAVGGMVELDRAAAPRVCQGCGQALSGRPDQKWCSAPCRARYRRTQVPVVAQEVTGGQGMDDSPFRRPATFVQQGPFEALAAVASMLSPGWRLEATPSSVVVTWSA